MSGIPLPLTTAQRGVWMGCLLRRQEGTFNVAEAIEIHGPVNPALFRQALVQVAQEAETTRVSIRMGARSPEQVVLPDLRCPLPFVDFADQPDPHGSAQEWMMQRVMAPVDLEKIRSGIHLFLNFQQSGLSGFIAVIILQWTGFLAGWLWRAWRNSIPHWWKAARPRSRRFFPSLSLWHRRQPIGTAHGGRPI